MKNIVLVGFMGTGKTTVGQILAGKLNRLFIDVDCKIETDCGMPVSEIFKVRGESFFRQQEQRTIKDFLPHNNAVVATGGGAILFAENVANLKTHGYMICLTATADRIVDRIGTDSTRPLLNAPNKEEVVASLLRERASRYQVADFTVDTSILTPGEVAGKIVAFLQEQAGWAEMPPDCSIPEVIGGCPDRS